MLITALTQFTTLDFPGRLACIVFTGGCNMRCGFCHNAEFVLPEKLSKLKTLLPFEVVKNFLKKRKGLLDGVVICGGEPTVQSDLLERIEEIKELGFAVKLDTNGSNPAVLKKLIERKLIDYVAMDLKDNFPYRKKLVGLAINDSLLKQSIQIIKESGIEHEFRTTILPEFHDERTLREMAKIVGGSRWAWQRFRNGKTLESGFEGAIEYDLLKMEQMKHSLIDSVNRIELRS